MVLSLDAAARVDPAAWLDLKGLTVLELTPADSPALRVSEALVPVERNERKRFGVDALSEDGQATLRALATDVGPSGARPSGASVAEVALATLSFVARGVAITARVLAAVVASVRSLLPLGIKLPAASGPHLPSGAREQSGLFASLEALAARALMRLRLNQLFQRRQAEYLARMMDLFERKDFQSALRHAIPLGDARSRARPALGVPSPRTDLALNARSEAATTAIALEAEWLQHLRRTYRAAFDELGRAGRVREAAFILAELLQEHAEAVAFLERHRELRLAAEMAEARGLEPALVVRQWFIAGDRERAILIARRTGTFADAVTRLERDPTRASFAQALRALWADHLARSGDYVAAIEVAWPVPELRRLARTWLDRAIELGGVGGARALARKVALGEAEPLGPEVEALLAEPSAESERLELAKQLVQDPLQPAVRPLARELCRSLVADAAESGHRLAAELVPHLARASQDAALRADLPAISERSKLALNERKEPLVLRWDTGFRGTQAVLDAVPLPKGRTLVALGEQGARLLGRAGQVLAQFDVPAHRIVLSDHGDRAITLAPRGSAVRVSRIDIVQRRTEVWTELVFEAHADTFDGETWLVAKDGDLLGLDALSLDVFALNSVRQVGGAGEPIRAITRDAQTASVIVWSHEAAELQLCEYELPRWRLRHRRPAPTSNCAALTFGAPAYFASLELDADAAPTACVLHVLQSGREALVRLEGDPISIGAQTPWLAVCQRHPDACSLRLLSPFSTPALRFELVANGAATLNARFAGDALTVSDNLGRVATLDLRFGEPLTSFSIR
jgi:hypothetical protein